jgi:tetrahydromethanopterin S-methyltransferase subunit B
MRYKDQALDKINQLSNIARTINFQVSRLESQDSILQTVDDLKEKIEELQSMISIEHDEFSSYI